MKNSLHVEFVKSLNSFETMQILSLKQKNVRRIPDLFTKGGTQILY